MRGVRSRRQGRRMGHFVRDAGASILVVQRHQRGGVRLLLLGEASETGRRPEIAWTMIRREELLDVIDALRSAASINRRADLRRRERDEVEP